ncbi:GATA zinc finger domain-containing protein 3 [Smittium culicis]|uniref:GATA zinc finger domain-containing protein 3 n=1 Tax=Smittium culicis TaxID=133412 RepID=A0A1R1YA52_9FUNG|nr:GATA zinc finger domain-containing protein 3 [Smittium culicis]OMJ23811.1 GATA zinc finger domain-containing protein 3 [Smittium culicis]
MITRVASPPLQTTEHQCFWSILQSPDLNFTLIPEFISNQIHFSPFDFESLSLYSFIHPKDSIQASSDIAKLITNKSFASIKLRIKYPFKYPFNDGSFARRASTPNVNSKFSEADPGHFRKLSLPHSNNILSNPTPKKTPSHVNSSRLSKIIEEDLKISPSQTFQNIFIVSKVTFYLISHDLLFALFHFDQTNLNECNCNLIDFSHNDITNINYLSRSYSSPKSFSPNNKNSYADNEPFKCFDFNYRHLQIFSKSSLSFLAAIPNLSFELMTSLIIQELLDQNTSFSQLYSLNSPKSLSNIRLAYEGGTLINANFAHPGNSTQPLDIIAFSLGKQIFLYIQCSPNSPFLSSCPKFATNAKRSSTCLSDSFCAPSKNIRSNFTLSKYKLDRPMTLPVNTQDSYILPEKYKRNSLNSSPLHYQLNSNPLPSNSRNYPNSPPINHRQPMPKSNSSFFSQGNSNPNALPNISSIFSYEKQLHPSRRSSSYGLIFDDHHTNRRNSQPEAYQSYKRDQSRPAANSRLENHKIYFQNGKYSVNNITDSFQNETNYKNTSDYKPHLIDHDYCSNNQIIMSSRPHNIENLTISHSSLSQTQSVSANNFNDLYPRQSSSLVSNAQFSSSNQFNRRYTLPSPIPNLLNKSLKNKLRLNQCISCGTTNSPEWRKGPHGQKTLCNACGLRYSRSIKKKKRASES